MIPRALTLLVLLGLVASTSAQEEQPRKYVEFKINPDFEKLLKNRMQMEQQLGPLKELMKKFADDPNNFPIDPEQFKDLKTQDPQFKEALKDWARSDPQLQEALREWMKNNPRDLQPENVQKFQDDLKNILDKEAGKLPTANKAPALPLLPDTNPIEPKDDAFTRATERAMKQAEDGKFGDWLKDSPAWKRAFQDLQSSMTDPDAARVNIGDWQNRLRLPDGKLMQLGEGALERMRNMPRPNLGRVDFPAPNLGRISLPRLSAPALPRGGAPSLPAIGLGLSWLLFAALLVVIGWLAIRWVQRSTAASADARVQLGPWPVRPERVSTRGELVLAFDYLAVLTIGFDVKSWNHHAVATQWRERLPECEPSARALASLYEQARYTEGAEALTNSQRDSARQSLRLLAEAL